jgi:mannan endo-1,4-beta-mannosidase
MRSRLVLLLTLTMAIAAVAFTIPRLLQGPEVAPTVAHASLPPRLASYLGAFAEGAPPAYQPLLGFGKAAGRQPNLVGYFSGWAEPFDTSFANSVNAHGAILFVQIDPTYASIAGIAHGDYDRYLRSYADSVRAYHHAVVIGFGHEMNGSWYPWSRVSPSVFVDAWRHVVTLFRSDGARNVTWLWTINAQDRRGVSSPRQWWPGPGYVNWVGIDGFYFWPSDTFTKIFANTINQVRSFTNKPVLLSETAVGPAAGQLLKIENLFKGMERYKTLGLVWFDINQDAGIYHQDWRIEDSPGAQAAFRLGVHDDLRPAGVVR